ncbi:MAG: endonuclease MutS2 [Candidatus Eisenbacteria bacterium]|nr:endonuclease MutS2 [Candidatus Eisenbacteria bacterium]
MDAHSLKVLELDKVKTLLLERIRFEPARERALALVPFDSRNAAEEELGLVQSYSDLLSLYDSPSFSLPDPGGSLQKVKVGGRLEPRALFEVAEFQKGVRVAKAFFETRKKEFPRVWHLASELRQTDEIEKKIFSAIEPSFTISDSASRELRRIRSEITKQRERILSTLKKEVGESAKQGDDSGITIRSERYVIPVRGDRSPKGKGIVHDRSQSGMTFFVEPLSVVEHNNRLIELRAQERDEEERILIELSSVVGEQLEPILGNVELVSHLALLRGKAELARRWDSRPIRFADEPRLRIRSFRHPLLLSVQSPGEVVPLDLELGDGKSILLISGPNAGGKTVALKTIGLLSAMSMSGLPIPAGDGSELPFFSDILADIGDEQSIEASLSTFSSHLKQITEIVERADSSTLVLLDEIGLGTDPSEGGAIAMAVLEHLASRKSFVIATTHLGELKLFASAVKEIENACMEFDSATEEPQFRLKAGIPGQSRAIATARRLGLRKAIVDRAYELLGKEKVKLETVLEELDSLSSGLEREKDSARKEREEAESLRKTYEEKIALSESEARTVKRKAREEARAMLSETRRVLEEARRLAKKNDLGLAETEKTKRSLEERERELEEPLFLQENRKEPVNLKPGTNVRVLGIDWEGTIVGSPDSHGRVSIEKDGIRIKVPVDALRTIGTDDGRARPHVTVTKSEDRTSSGTVDVRGMRVDEAMSEVDRALDTALLQGKDEIRIIHGIGKGILKKTISDMLKSHPSVKEIRDAEIRDGGKGVTIVLVK